MEAPKRIAANQEEVRRRKRGERAEQVASWYFRLNGCLSIPGFIVHPDVIRRYPFTEADLIAVRFPHSREVIAGRPMTDDDTLTKKAAFPKTLFLLVEVKTDLCAVNGPWSDREQGNMFRVINRLGFAVPSKVGGIADAMYSALRWEDERTVLQYVAVGRRFNDGLQRQSPQLLQITWDTIADFLFERFRGFPEKLGDGRRAHEQWPDFGRYYGNHYRRLKSSVESRDLLWRYIDVGRERLLPSDASPATPN